MRNRERIIGVLRRSPLTPLTYSDIKATADVPVGSFDRTLAALVADGNLVKGDDGYTLVNSFGDGSRARREESRAGSGTLAFCARCGGSRPKPDRASGETLEDIHRRVIAP